MEIKIEIPEWKCEQLLLANNYISEEVTVYYESNIGPYDNAVKGALYPIKTKIAYPAYAKPQALDKEFPLSEDLKEFKYQKVVNRLFNEMLWETIEKDKIR